MNRLLEDRKAAFIFIAPAFLLFTLILFVPIIQVIYYSLCNYTGLTKPDFVGLKNYIDLFTSDETMKIALKNSIFFMLFSGVTQQIVGLFLRFY